MRMNPTRRALLAAIGLAAVGTTVPAAPVGEPSEADMLAAYQRRLQGVNNYTRSTAEQCQRGEYKRGQGDPVLAMQCLAFGSTGAGGGAPAMKATQFRKIACEKAQGEPGYWCDYTAGIDMNMPLPPSMANLMRGGSVSTARFVRTESGWLMMPSRSR